MLLIDTARLFRQDYSGNSGRIKVKFALQPAMKAKRGE
jgi:hypothetical protein